jgi:membrane-associated phospholipid phosphatase
MAVPALSFSASQIDGSWFTDVTEFARNTRWFNTPMVDYSSLGMVLFAAFIVAAWWIARRADTVTMSAALAVPVAAVVAYLVNDGIKWIVGEQRPCYQYPQAYLLEQCPPITDTGFPSNHAAVVAAMAAALFLVNRRLAVLASAAAAIMGFSRVYVGAHYPHDVFVGLLVGAIAGTATALIVRKYAPPLVDRFAQGRLRLLLTAG